MADSLILETTFLIDLERERSQGKPGIATGFLERHQRDRLLITPTVLGEVAAGLEDEGRERWDRFLQPFRVLEINREVCWQYSRIFRHLRDNGLLIGTNDLWIAATARAYDLPLVTRNEKHFGRVPGLSVVSYTA